MLSAVRTLRHQRVATGALRRGRRRLVLVGGGLSSVAVVLHLARDAAAHAGLEILLVDRTGETGGGTAYHRAVHPALLLNDPVRKIDSTGLGFGDWLLARRARLLAALAHRATDDRVAGWLRTYGDALARGEISDLYAPRAVFGMFVRDRFAAARGVLAAAGARTEVITAHVVGMTPVASTAGRAGHSPAGLARGVHDSA